MPVLEDLELKNCGFADFQEIVSGTLKSLTVDDCFAKQPPADDKWRVRVTATRLVSLTYRRLKHIRLSTLPLPQAKLAGMEPRVVTASCAVE